MCAASSLASQFYLALAGESPRGHWRDHGDGSQQLLYLSLSRDDRSQVHWAMRVLCAGVRAPERSFACACGHEPKGHGAARVRPIRVDSGRVRQHGECPGLERGRTPTMWFLSQVIIWRLCSFDSIPNLATLHTGCGAKVIRNGVITSMCVHLSSACVFMPTQEDACFACAILRDKLHAHRSIMILVVLFVPCARLVC